MAENALLPKSTGANKLVDFVMQRLPADRFPTNARTLLETVQGNRDPISEGNFSPEELAALKELIMLKGGDKGNITYADYRLLADAMRNRGQIPASLSPHLFSMADPLGNLMTTLGQFNYARDANGNLVAKDIYDFNPPPQSAGELKGRNTLNGYGFIREYAGEKIPPGYGRPVNIKLGQ